MADNGVPLKIWGGITQSFAFPTVYAAQHKMAVLETEMAGLEYDIAAYELRKAVALTYYEIVFQKQQKKLLHATRQPE